MAGGASVATVTGSSFKLVQSASRCQKYGNVISGEVRKLVDRNDWPIPIPAISVIEAMLARSLDERAKSLT